MNKHIGNLERPGDGALPPDGDGPLRRLKKKEPPSFLFVGVVLLAVLSGVPLILTLPALVGADSIFDFIKCGVIGVAGAFVAYFINRLAIERGAVQAAVGSLISGFTSIAAMLLVGVGMFTATYAGFTVERTEQLRLSAYADEQARYLGEVTGQARAAARVGPAMASLLDDLTQLSACERETSCLSGAPASGEGPVFRLIAGEQRRAEALAGVITEGELRLAAELDTLKGLQAELQLVVADETLSRTERRTRAADVANRMTAAAAALSEASPLAAVQGFTETLGQGVSVPGRPEVEARLNRLFAAHRTQLQMVLASIPAEHTVVPQFPAPAGVADTLGYVGAFLPLALLLVGTELVAPITLWIITFVALKARVEEDDPEGPGGTPPAPSSLAPLDNRRGRR